MRLAYEQALELLTAQDLYVDLAEARLTYARAAGSGDELRRAREAFARIGANAFLAEIDGELASASA